MTLHKEESHIYQASMKMFQNPFRFEMNPAVNGQNTIDIFEGIDGNDVLDSVDGNSISFESSRGVDGNSISFESNSSDSIVFERLDSYDDSISSNSISPKATAELIESTEIALFGPKPANNLMMLSLLEHLCTLYVDNEETGQRLFEVLCRKLCGMKLIQNFGTLDNAKAIRQKYQAAFVDMMNSALETLNPSLHPEKIWHMANKRSVTSLSLHSWYKDMFHEEKLIAHGGFGEVCQAKNKLDQKVYAIKKVKLIESQPDICQKTLREVQVFSNLNHPNVVRYHSSWLEYGITEFTGSKMDESDGINSDNQYTPPRGNSNLVSLDVDLLGSHFGNFNVGLLKNKKTQRYISYKRDSECLSNGSCEENQEQNGDDDDASSVCSVSPANDEKPGRRRTPSLGRSYSSGDVPLHRNQMEEISYCRGKFYDANLRKALNMTLFIQMELCELTLRKWLDDRNHGIQESSSSVNRCSNLRILKQIVSAIQYIHEEGLIHRDIKPANIFLNLPEGSNIAIKIGDFGLARDDILPKTPTSEITQVNLPIPCYALQPNLDHTRGVGTAVYAAPEQKSTRYYSNKVDIFSAGIILFELYRPFNTDMERLKSIEELLNVPACGGIEETWSDECKLILEMTSRHPDKRPTAESVLGLPLLRNNFDANNIDQLRDKLSCQELEIKRLRQLLQEAESKICRRCQLECTHGKPEVAQPS